jgi:Fe-S cluster biogenesis protein NfuA
MTDIEKYEAVEKVMEESIRPYLIADGGNCELDLVKGNEVVISFQGACGSCPSSAGGTLRGIERALRNQVHPDIIVIPTNSYKPQNTRQHPFGGKTYEEELQERNQGEV